MGLVAGLDGETRDWLLEHLNYLNLAELGGFCQRHGIPRAVMVDRGDGRLRSSRITDRKGAVLRRVREYLTTGAVPSATVIPVSAVSEQPLPGEPSADDRLYFDQYDKRNDALMAELRRLTGGRFRNGAVARILCMEFWTNGQAPTLAEYAEAWTVADGRGLGVERGEHPEAAYLTDRARGEAGSDWKTKRSSIADQVLGILDSLEPVQQARSG